MLLDFIIEGYQQGKIKIITKDIHYRKGHKHTEYIKKDHYLQYENGDVRRIGKNEREELESIQQNNLT